MPKRDGTVPVLTPEQLASRWDLTTGTLRNWRSKGLGPAYIRVGWGRGRVRYRLVDVEAYERRHLVKAPGR